ncbi:hypothetical protein OAK87_00605 [bacterium]|nr:hypothetical protein [bacterium]
MKFQSKTALARTQTELEQIASLEYKRNLIYEHKDLASKDYYSATRHGRKLTGGAMDFGTEEFLVSLLNLVAMPRRIFLDALASSKTTGKTIEVSRFLILCAVIEARINKCDPRTTGHREAVEFLQGLEMAIERGKQTEDGYGLDRGSHVIAALLLKTVVDGIGMGNTGDNESQWPMVQGVWQKVGDRCHLQFMDALTFAITPEGHQNQVSRTKKKHQTPKSKRTNAMLGQRDALDAAGYDVKAFRWSKTQEVGLGAYLLDCIFHIDLVEMINGERKGVQEPPRYLRPQGHIISNFVEVMERWTEGRLISSPLIEAPKKWTPTKGAGHKNTTGGFHSESHRKFNPLVRSHGGDNGTKPSQLLLDFLNVLGKTALKPDQAMMDAMLWAVATGQEKCDVPLRPIQTAAQLDLVGAQNARDIEAKGHIVVNGVAVFKGTPEHSVWKRQRRDQYEEAIDRTMRFIRTLTASKAVDVLRNRDRLHYSWSADYRLRCYPQQTMLSPQGCTYETALLTFEEGERIETAQQLFDVHCAIGAAFLGTQTSYEEREEWAIKNLPEILLKLSDDGTDPQDLAVLVSGWDPDEVWDALALVRQYRRAVLGDELWHLPLAVDASQSCYQIFSGLLGDTAGLINTNILRADDNPWENGPVDGYSKVGDAAKRLLVGDHREQDIDQLRTELVDEKFAEKFADMDLHVAYQIQDLLHHEKKRKLEKPATMPKAYGIAWSAVHRQLRNVIAEKLEINLSKKGGWEFAKETTSGLTSFLDAGVKVTYPAAIQTLKWLRALANRSIEKQTKAHELKHEENVAKLATQWVDDGNDPKLFEAPELPAFVPTLKWTLSDGSVIDYWLVEPETKDIRSAHCGRLRTVIGNQDQPRTKKMVNAFAPGFVHSLDSLILREAFADWDGPIITIHDAMKVLPSRLPELRERVWKAYKKVVAGNPLEGLARQMGIELDQLPPLPIGDADLDIDEVPKYMLH